MLLVTHLLPPSFHLEFLKRLLPVNTVAIFVGLPVTVSAANACVRNSMSHDMKKMFGKKKGILNFAFPRSLPNYLTEM